MGNENETEREKLLREQLEELRRQIAILEIIQQQQKDNEYEETRSCSKILVFLLIAPLAALLIFIILFSILN